MMICPKCQTTNTVDSRFCNQCGANLRSDHFGGHRGRPVVFTSIIISAVCLVFLTLWVAHHRIDPIAKALEDIPDHTDDDFDSRETVSPSDRGIAAAPHTTENLPMVIPVGTLVLEDITGRSLHRAVVPIVDAGWVVLPMHLQVLPLR